MSHEILCNLRTCSCYWWETLRCVNGVSVLGFPTEDLPEDPRLSKDSQKEGGKRKAVHEEPHTLEVGERAGPEMATDLRL